MTWTAWTNREEDTLRAHYPSKGLAAVEALLPGRSQEAIRQRLSQLKIKHHSTWQPYEIATLRNLYPVYGMDAVLAALPHRTEKSIYSKANKCAVYRTNADRGRWPAWGVV